MRAMILKEFGHPLDPGEVAEPCIGPHDALVKVGACGICRTDVKIRKGEIPPPIINLPHIMGHEVAGEVVAVGDEVCDFKRGDRVAVYIYIPCGNCRACRGGRENLCPALKRVGFEIHGAFAEYIAVPARQLLKIGDMPFEKAAVLTDAVIVPYHAIRQQAAVKVGDTLLIVGVGGLGIHAVQIARLAGAYTIAVDVTDDRLALAKELGADETINARACDPLKEVRRLTAGAGVDAVIENVGTPETMAWTLPSMRKGGKLVVVGYAPGRPFVVDSMAMHYNEWEIIGSRLGTKPELGEVINLVNRGHIRPWVTRSFPLEQANEALDLLAEDAISGRGVLIP